jgi:predicted Zn-dependent peptidase
MMVRHWLTRNLHRTANGTPQNDLLCAFKKRLSCLVALSRFLCSRENIVLRAKFLREDLPYFVEVLADVLCHTKLTAASVVAAFHHKI